MRLIRAVRNVKDVRIAIPEKMRSHALLQKEKIKEEIRCNQ